MKASELMQGDWVTGPDRKPTQVRNVLVEAVLTTDWQGLDERDGDIHPIPLTDEILKRVKEGMGKEFYFDYWALNGGRYNIEITTTSTRFDIAKEMIIKASYVHELQHALRLCGIEKEVVL